ncbi:MAG: hypothetical protein GF387_01940 [Candidatus Portnoybacteria bacterium]|nr:hypothetical protein [Candidatus Portnoybacteria bacterium]
MIENLKDLKKFIKKKINYPVFGAGVYPFNKLGPEDFLPDYRIVSLKKGIEGKRIKKDIKVFSLKEGDLSKKTRNTTTIICNPKTEEYLKKFKKINILTHKSSRKMEKYCKKRGWNIIAAPSKFNKTIFENKTKIRKILKEINIPTPSGKSANLNSLHYGHLINSYGLPFVIQSVIKRRKKRTFFINNKKDFDSACEELKSGHKEVLVTRFVKGPAISIIGCVTRHGIISTNPQYKIIDNSGIYDYKKELGLFHGHDWSFYDFSEKIETQVYNIVNELGKYLKRQGYKGIFNITMVIEKEVDKVYVLGANSHLPDSFPVITMIQLKNKETPILAFHILEHMDISYEIDINKINSLMRKSKKGGQVIIYNSTARWATIGKTVKPGVYKLENKKPKFVRPGYKLRHLKNKSEFIVSGGILPKNQYLSPSRRVCRIMALRGFLKNDQKLSRWGNTVIRETYRLFKISPIRFFKIKKIFSRNLKNKTE